ncbi:MAG: S41 family peptidase [Devosiaceae bacterium]|nr:S41 family peptidase [Devosiaceae bacterium]
MRLLPLNKSNPSYLNKSIISVFMSIFILMAAASFPSFAQESSKEEVSIPLNQDEIYDNLKLFGEVFDRIRAEYVDVPDEQELIRAAIDGMLTSLDPHSAYLTPKSYNDMMQDTSGKFGGLGIQVTMEDGLVKIVSPIDDTPASRAGLLANDLIIKLDDKQVKGMTLDDAVTIMKGAIGTKIVLTIIREGVTEPIEYEITRDIISVSAARWYIEQDVGVLRLTQFSGQAFTGIEKGIKAIFEERDNVAPLGLILDLRNNPGGLVDQAVFVADAFLDKGVIVLTRGRTERESSRYEAKADDLDRLISDIPLIVLINGGSASSSEILAGALQDQKRATLVGTRSFGKGTVQNIIDLGNGDGAMRLTTSRYYTPSNRSIQALGIAPDIEIFQNVPDELKGKDTIINEAELEGSIDSEKNTQEEDENKETDVGSSVYVPSDKTKDTQLNYAIDLILGKETNEAFPPKAE